MTRLESMIRDTATPAKSLSAKPAKPETFRSHVPAIAAAATGTVLAAILGSMIGTAGTIVGMAVGSLASGTCSWWAERAIRRSAALAAAQAEALRSWSHLPHTGETAGVAARSGPTATAGCPGGEAEPSALASALADTVASTAAGIEVTTGEAAPPGGGQHGRPRRRWRWSSPIVIVLVAFAAAAAVVTVVEGAAGKPLSAVVQGQPGHGTTLGGGAVAPAAKPSTSPTTSVSPPVSASGSVSGPSPSSSASSSASSSPSASNAPAPTPSGTGESSPAPTAGIRSADPSGSAAGR